jgi:hypothetical protein
MPEASPDAARDRTVPSSRDWLDVSPLVRTLMITAANKRPRR